MADQDPCIAVICTGCRRASLLLVRSVATQADRDEIGDLVLKGYEVRQLQVIQARTIDFGCECRKLVSHEDDEEVASR